MLKYHPKPFLGKAVNRRKALWPLICYWSELESEIRPLHLLVSQNRSNRLKPNFSSKAKTKFHKLKRTRLIVTSILVLPMFAGIQVSCPYLLCNFKNSQFQQAGRFPSGKLFFLNSFKHNLLFRLLYNLRSIPLALRLEVALFRKSWKPQLLRN